MKVLCAVILLLGVVAHCHGYSYLIPARQNQDGVCYFNGHVLPKGDSKMPTVCQNLRCNDDGSILVQGCGRLNIKNCTLLGPTQNSGLYPDCCEMNYECKDRDGRVFMRQWNQLKAEIGRGEQEEREGNLEQTAEAIKAAKELLEQIRRQAQRDGRIDLRGQSDQVESELLILRQIYDQQGQQVKRGILGEADRQAQDQKRRLQLARMEEELSILVKMSKGVMQLSTNEFLKDYIVVRQEVEGILEIIRNEIGKQQPQLGEELQKLGQLKVRQARQIQQGVLDQAQLDTQIPLQTLVIEKELKALLGIGQVDQLENLQGKLYNLVEKIEQQIRVQKPEVRAQLRQALNELDILSQMRDRQRRQDRQGITRQEEMKEVQIQQRRVDDQLRILAQKWARKVDASEPMARIVRLVRQQVPRLGYLVSDELPALLKGIEDGLQELERIRIIKQDGIFKRIEDEQQEEEIKGRIVQIEKDMRSVLQMLEQGIRLISQGSQVDQDVLAILMPLKDQILRSRRRSKVLELGQVGDRDFLQLTRKFLVLFGDVIDKQLGVGIPNLRVDVNRVQTELQILAQLRARRARLNKLGQLNAVDDQKMQEAIRKQKEQLEREMAILVRLDMQKSEPEFEGPAGLEERELLRVEALKLKEQNRLLYEQLEILDPIRAQKEEQRQEQIKIAELEPVERQLQILLQRWSVAMENFDESRFSGQFGQDIKVILDRLVDLIRDLEPNKFPKLKVHLKRIELGVNNLDQIKARRVQPSVSAVRQQLEEIRDQRERIEWDLFILLQVLGQDIQQGGENLQIEEERIQTILQLVALRISKEGLQEHPELHAQVNSVEEELRILSELNARQVRQGLEGKLNEGQREEQKEEIRLQLDRLKRSLMAFLPMFIGRSDLVESGGQYEEVFAAVLDLARDRLQGQVQQPGALKELAFVTEKLEKLIEILKRRGGASQSQRLQLDREISEQRKEIDAEMGTLLKMLAQPMGQIKQEGREIMELARDQVFKLGSRQVGNDLGGEGRQGEDGRQGRDDRQVGEERQELEERQESEERGRFEERQDRKRQQDREEQQGLGGQQDRQSHEDRQAREDRRDREDRRSREGRQGGEGRQGRGDRRNREDRRVRDDRQGREGRQDLENRVSVRIFKDGIDEGERLKNAIQALQRLKTQLPKVSEAERAELVQQINKQRDSIDTELRSIFQIKAMKDDLDARTQAVINQDFKGGRRFIW